MSTHTFKNDPTHLVEHCRPTGDILAKLGDKWTVAVLGNLSNGQMRFSELDVHIGGISQRMLTLTLRSLERDGLVSRRITPTVPPRVDYSMTPRGQALMEPLGKLHLWATENHHDIARSRQAFDAVANNEL